MNDFNWSVVMLGRSVRDATRGREKAAGSNLFMITEWAEGELNSRHQDFQSLTVVEKPRETQGFQGITRHLSLNSVHSSVHPAASNARNALRR